MCGTAAAASSLLTVIAHQLGPGARQRLDLSDRALDVRRVGVGHRLHDDGGVAADGDRADLDGQGFSA